MDRPQVGEQEHIRGDAAHLVGGTQIFVGEAGTNQLRIFDWNRHLLSTLTLPSPPTGVIVENEHVLLLESGILSPNDEPKGSLVRYDFPGHDSLHFDRVLIDSLFRPVFVESFDFDGDGRNEFVICNVHEELLLYEAHKIQHSERIKNPAFQ